MKPCTFKSYHSMFLVRVACAIVALHLGAAVARGAGQYPAKPARASVGQEFLQDMITVKFRDGASIRLRNGKLSDLGSGELNAAQATLTQLAQGEWQRAHKLEEQRLDDLRATAERNAGRVMPDLNLQFNLKLPAGFSAAAAINALNALDIVEMAQAIPAVVKTAAPDFTANQAYRRTTPVGVGTDRVRNLTGGDGGEVRIADIEFSWNLSHADLPAVTVLAAGYDPFNDKNHGTAVLGVLGAKDDGSGITGIVPDAQLFVSPAMTAVGQGASYIPSAISLAASALREGDVMLLELQIQGPNYQPCCDTNSCAPQTDCQFGLVPIEWYRPAYDALMVAAQAGIVIVEAAGNGSQNLDDPIYVNGNNGHWPFITNHPGIIMVGAGAAPLESNGSAMDRSRLSFSNFGGAVDVQGWGEGIWTTGYGTALGSPGYAAGGINQLYTGRFNGTSGASAMIAGAVAQLQSIYKAVLAPIGGQTVPDPLTTQQIQELLIETGQAQMPLNPMPPGNPHIGPRPDIALALRRMGSLAVDERRWCHQMYTGGQVIPPMAYGHKMVYDSMRQRLVVIGGRLFNGQDNYDTWEFDGSSWMIGFSSPFPHTSQFALAYDSSRGVMVKFGGSDSNTAQVVNTHLEFDGFTWNQRFTPNSPGALYDPAMAFDAGRGVMVLFGGGIGNTPNLSGQTWEFNGANWSLRSNSGPLPRVEHVMAYDSARGRIVLHGGHDWSGSDTNDTWEWDGFTWTKRNITSPVAGSFGRSMAYDAARGLMVMATPGDSTTWEYDGKSWVRVDMPNTLDMTPGATMALMPAVAYFSPTQQVMNLSGSSTSGGFLAKFVPALGFTELPVSQTVDAGDMVMFGAHASNSAGAMYHWMRNNMPVTNGPNISGANTPMLTINAATQADAGVYQVHVLSADPCDFVNTHWISAPMIPAVANAVLTIRSCVGDINGDGVVNIDDLVELITHWGAAGGIWDLNGDGIVNIDDLVLLITHWGMCP